MVAVAVFTVQLHVMQCTVLRRPFCLSVCLSVRLSNAYVVIKRKRLISAFYTTQKMISFLIRRMVGAGRPLLPEILGETAPVGAKTPIFNRYSLIAPQQ